MRACSPAGGRTMALRTCRDCGRSVSQRARACPGCGRPAAAGSGPGGCLRAPLLIVGAVAAAVAWVAMTDSRPVGPGPESGPVGAEPAPVGADPAPGPAPARVPGRG